MTIINPNSIAGITSVTAEAGVMNFYKSDGTLAGLQLNGVNFNTTAGVSTFNNLYVGGVLTYEDVKNVDSIGIVTASDHIKITTDNKSLYLGASDDFQLFHNGSHNIIKSNNGNLYLQDDSYIEIGHPNGTVAAGFIPTGATNLRFNGNTKLATNNTGVTVTGTVAATSYTGDGSNLTSLPAQATIANNADNRVITGGSGVNLNGESNLTFNGTRLSVTGNVYVAGSQNAQLTTNQLIFDRAGYSYIDQIDNAGSLVFRVTSSNTIGLRIDSNAQAIFGSSLIIPDAIQHEGDLDCKIRFPGTDTITFETASNERLRITSTGQVAIGTDTAETGYIVSMHGDLSLGEKGGVSNTYIDQKQDGDLHLINSGRTANGASGSPGTAGVGINRYNNISGGTSLFRDFCVYNGKNSKVLYVDGSTSNVGIGTDSPDLDLHVKDASGQCGVWVEGNDGGAGAYILLKNNSTASNPKTYVGGVDAGGQGTSQVEFHNLDNGTNEGALSLHTRPASGSMQERLRLTSGVVASFGNSSPPAWSNDKGYYNI